MMTITEMTRLLLERRRPAKTLNRDDVPSQQGLYVWYATDSGEVYYVGKAAGRGGLRRRIGRQHLNPKYLETRPERFRPGDEFQLSCGVEAGGRVCVDKSVFRRNLGRLFGLAPGDRTVQYIREKLAVAWLTADLLGDITKCELDLIRQLRPKLNAIGVSRAPRNQVVAADPDVAADGRPNSDFLV